MSSLTVHVIDRQELGIRGRRVACHYSLFSRGQAYTDDRGIARFNDFPIGPVKVFVDGKKEVVVSVGASEHKDVTVMLGD